MSSYMKPKSNPIFNPINFYGKDDQLEGDAIQSILVPPLVNNGVTYLILYYLLLTIQQLIL